SDVVAGHRYEEATTGKRFVFRRSAIPRVSDALGATRRRYILRHQDVAVSAELDRTISTRTESLPVNPTTARLMLTTFARRGVRAAFGIPGGFVSPFFDALADVPRIELITTRHEGMAAFCALGHAIATGQPALVLTTSGPGFTNAITGIAGAT